LKNKGKPESISSRMEFTKEESRKLGELAAKIQWKYDPKKLLQKRQLLTERLNSVLGILSLRSFFQIQQC